MHMLCMHFHSLPSARVVYVGPVCDPQNQVGVIGLTGRIQKDKTRRVDTGDTVRVQEYHVHSNVDGLRVLPADVLSPRRHRFVHAWSVRWQPVRFERMATVFITDCVHTPGDSHVHPPGDVNRSNRGLPYLRALLPTSCVQGADIMMIIDRNEGANLWRRQLFRNNAQKNLSVTIMSDRLVNW